MLPYPIISFLIVTFGADTAAVNLNGIKLLSGKDLSTCFIKDKSIIFLEVYLKILLIGVI